MSQFLGTHVNRLDAKGRVSIPASFRTTLRAANATTNGADEIAAPGALILRPSHKDACIEGWAAATFMTLASKMERLDLFGDDSDDLAFTLYADASELEADKEGRIVLPAALAAHAGLGETVAFVGLGRQFQIWDPQAVATRRALARERARERGLVLPGGLA